MGIKPSLSFVFFVSVMTACGTKESPSAQLSSVTAFCSAASTEIWSAQRVQQEVQHLATQTPFCGSPHGAYVFAYKEMTAKRDSARCDTASNMSPRRTMDARLNDMLAQLMTENYLKIVSSCVFDAPSGKSLDHQWCQLHSTAETENWNSVRVAFGSTAIYLTSHMALAVAALPHIDSLWTDTDAVSLDERIKKVREFKETYDAFNGFLAKNLSTVSQSLEENGFLHHSLLGTGSRIASKIPGGALVFGNIRDTTFQLGLELAQNLTEHPWLMKDEEGSQVLKNLLGPTEFTPKTEAERKTISEIEEHSFRSQRIFTTPLSGILGGKSFTDSLPNQCWKK